jgi:hypothetical protein
VSCRWCERSPCPHDFECPTCLARIGTHCKRPSGHKAWTPHVKRYELAGWVLKQPLEDVHEQQLSLE